MKTQNKGGVLSELMRVLDEIERIDAQKDGIIDELFMLVCQYTDLDVNDLEPIINSISDVVNRQRKEA
jgi:hypothetical protein